MTGRRQPPSAWRLASCSFAAAVLWSASVPAQKPAGELRMVLVSADRIRSVEENQRVVTGLLRAAYQEVEVADEILGKKRDLEPVLEVIAGAGRMSHDLASPSRETHEGLSVPLIGFCGETPEAAWTEKAVRAGYAADSRVGRLARSMEAFTLGEAHEAVVVALGELEGVEKGRPEAEAALDRAEARLNQALQVYMSGVVGPFAEFLAEGAARLGDPAVVSELCAQRGLESLTAREEPPGGGGDAESPDPALARATRDRALKTIQSTLATLDNFVLPRDANQLEVAQGFTGPVRTKTVEPVYSNFARRACIEGEVRLELGIDHDGVPRRIRVLRGSPELAESAVAAAEQWRFEPASLNEEPIAFDYRLTVNFDLKGTEATRCRQSRVLATSPN